MEDQNIKEIIVKRSVGRPRKEKIVKEKLPHGRPRKYINYYCELCNRDCGFLKSRFDDHNRSKKHRLNVL